jgi:hypothetical protein
LPTAISLTSPRIHSYTVDFNNHRVKVTTVL